MLSVSEAKAQRKALLNEIAIEHRRKDREKLVALRAKIPELKRARREAMRGAVDLCRTERIAHRARAKQRAEELRAAARQAVRLAREEEKQAARSSCHARKQAIRESHTSDTAKARQMLKEERQLQRELKRIEGRMRKRERETQRNTAKERAQESDDDVRQNIPGDLLPLFERVKKSIKGSTRMSRTETFLQYAEENPHEVVDAQVALSQREIARLIREEAALARAVRHPKRYKPTAEELASVPF